MDISKLIKIIYFESVVKLKKGDSSFYIKLTKNIIFYRISNANFCGFLRIEIKDKIGFKQGKNKLNPDFTLLRNTHELKVIVMILINLF